MIRTTVKDFSENIDKILNSNNSGYIAISEFTEATYGNQNDCDFEYCKEHNIPVYNVKRDGGTIVYAKVTVNIAMIFDVKYGWISENFNSHLINYLKEHISLEHTIEPNANDILIDGYKVASGTELRVGENLEKIYAVFQLSINQDIEAIKHICKKEMVKIPKALSDFGITTEEIVNFCEDYWDNFIKN